MDLNAAPVGSLGAFGQPASSSSTSGQFGGADLGKEEFLKLLVTQLSHQDPMNPMDGHEFVAELAQFSSVEQLTNISEGLSQSIEMNNLVAQSVNSGVAAGLIGKTVESPGDAVAWKGEGEPPLRFDLAGPATSVEVTIRNESGAVVRTMTLDAWEEGANTSAWDGKNDDGSRVPEGVYSFEVNATDASGEPVAASTYTRGQVDRISFGPEGTQLWIGGIALPMGLVTSVESD